MKTFFIQEFADYHDIRVAHENQLACLNGFGLITDDDQLSWEEVVMSAYFQVEDDMSYGLFYLNEKPNRNEIQAAFIEMDPSLRDAIRI